MSARKVSSMDAHVGAKLREARVIGGLSQEQLGEAAGVTFQQIQKYEIGSNRIAASRLYDLARILDVPTSYFFEGLQDFNDTAVRDPGLDIVSAVASIDDEQIKSRIVTFIEDVSGRTVAKSA